MKNRKKIDMVIIGVPVYAGRVPAFLIDYFSKVRGNQTKAVFIVVYDRCIKKCPVNAKAILQENFIQFTRGLIDKFSNIRHEPELFL